MIGQFAKTESACAFVTNLSHGTFWRLEIWLRGREGDVGDRVRHHRCMRLDRRALP